MRELVLMAGHVGSDTHHARSSESLQNQISMIDVRPIELDRDVWTPDTEEILFPLD